MQLEGPAARNLTHLLQPPKSALFWVSAPKSKQAPMDLRRRLMEEGGDDGDVWHGPRANTSLGAAAPPNDPPPRNSLFHFSHLEGEREKDGEGAIMIHLPAAGRYASYMYSRSGRNKKCDLAAEERLALRKKPKVNSWPPSFFSSSGKRDVPFCQRR